MLSPTQLPDFINSCLEFGGGLMVFNHARVLHQQKEVKGVSILAIVFFLLWGIWNTFYYRWLHQYLSFLCGFMATIANFTWLSMALYYKRVNPLTVARNALRRCFVRTATRNS